MNPWYETLQRPPLTPPNWIFAPVWTVLYLSITVAIVLYYRTPGKPHLLGTSLLLAAHLAANFTWTYLFFGLQSPPAALADIIFMDVSLVILILWFWRIRPLAGMLLVPYLLWILFATYLNIGFHVLN